MDKPGGGVSVKACGLGSWCMWPGEVHVAWCLPAVKLREAQGGRVNVGVQADWRH